MTDIRTETNTLPKYLFELKSSIGREVFYKETPCLEWSDAELTFERFLDKGGVFSTFNVGSLTFIGKAAKLISDNFNTDEINAECEFVVKWFNQETQSYEDFPTTYELNFKTYKIVKIDKFGIGINIEAKKNGLLEKLNNRSDIDVDVTKTESIGGYKVVDYPNLKSLLKMPKIETNLDGIYNDSEGNRVGLSESTFQLKGLQANEFEGDLKEIEDNEIPSKENSFIFESSRNRYIILNGTCDITSIVSTSSPSEDSRIELKVQIYDEEGVEIEEKTVSTSKRLPGTQSDKFIWYIEFEIEEKQSVSCTIGYTDVIESSDSFSWSNTEFKVTDKVLSVDTTIIDSMPVYEALERNLQLILDKQYPLYSDYLSRLDNKWNPYENYTTENQLRFASYTSGIALRGESLDNSNNPLILNFRDNFKTLQSLYNLGYGLESFIDGVDRIRVEEYSYFFKDEETIDLSSRISRLDIETDVIPQLCYVSVISGFENYEYEAIDGRGEYNTKNKRTTVLNADAEFNNVAPYRGDTLGIVSQLEKNINITNTTDASGDNDTFIIKSQKYTDDTSADWKAEQEQNIEVLEETSPYDFGGLNLYYLPTRSLNRNSSRWTCGLQKQLSSFVRFQVAGKNQTLKSKGKAQSDDDEYIVTENDNLQIGDIYTLNQPIYRPIKHTVEVELSLNDINTIKNNIYGLIRFTPTLTGWLLKLSKKNNEDKAIVTIIEKYVS